jgi:hypothetical protein
VGWKLLMAAARGKLCLVFLQRRAAGSELRLVTELVGALPDCSADLLFRSMRLSKVIKLK